MKEELCPLIFVRRLEEENESIGEDWYSSHLVNLFTPQRRSQLSSQRRRRRSQMWTYRREYAGPTSLTNVRWLSMTGRLFFVGQCLCGDRYLLRTIRMMWCWEVKFEWSMYRRKRRYERRGEERGEKRKDQSSLSIFVTMKNWTWNGWSNKASGWPRSSLIQSNNPSAKILISQRASLQVESINLIDDDRQGNRSALNQFRVFDPYQTLVRSQQTSYQGSIISSGRRYRNDCVACLNQNVYSIDGMICLVEHRRTRRTGRRRRRTTTTRSRTRVRWTSNVITVSLANRKSKSKKKGNWR